MTDSRIDHDLYARIVTALASTRLLIADSLAIVSRVQAQNAQQQAETADMRAEAGRQRRRARAMLSGKLCPEDHAARNAQRT